MTAPTTTTVVNDSGRAFLVRLVRKGERYGREDCLTHEGEDPLVEFYDLTYVDRFGPRGQFVSRYYLTTLSRDAVFSSGLRLDGGVPEWSLDKYDVMSVVRWALWARDNSGD
ncbi:MAG: hypothetical protein P1V36_01700 [Planctomycetota bacterium]|nr:hypothetical protein [Planctomycetota bacterium]